MHYKITKDGIDNLKKILKENNLTNLERLIGLKFESESDFLKILHVLLGNDGTYENYGCKIIKEFEINERKAPYLSLWESFRSYKWVFIGICLFIITLYIIFFFAEYPPKGIPSEPNATSSKPDGSIFGSIGDSFGAINTLFSGIAFAALIISIHIQQKELRNNIEQIELNRIEFISQNNVLSKQRFENTFFRLIEMYNEIVNSIVFEQTKKEYVGDEPYLYGGVSTRGQYNKYKKDEMGFYKEVNTTYTGRESFKYALYYFGFKVDNNETTPILNIVNSYDNPITRYSKCYDHIAPSFEHYHKILYQIINLIKENEELNGNYSKVYSKIIRSMLTRNELELLFFHGLGSIGVKKFKKLIERYKLFEHLPLDLDDIHSNICEYEIDAYGNNEKTKKEYLKK
ncbi:putative phage abortive infection protein [Desulfogranum japonicum]|uniref:putative phage abortive infection protein n=1 Tax=Desulfogranum japonicum TaxID=231447 RepID=UPI0003FA279C|nr:putative phage abortive infection protein [Desulfogranum japonicum]